MGLAADLQAVFDAELESDTVTLLGTADVTPASGAPGAWQVARTDAAATADWWLAGMTIENPSGAALFNYTYAQPQAGTTNIVTSVHLEVATDAGGYHVIEFPILVRIPSGSGAAVRQETASTKTCDVTTLYALGLGT